MDQTGLAAGIGLDALKVQYNRWDWMGWADIKELIDQCSRVGSWFGWGIPMGVDDWMTDSEGTQGKSLRRTEGKEDEEGEGEGDIVVIVSPYINQEDVQSKIFNIINLGTQSSLYFVPPSN
ncbi:hypothetical protein EYC84_005997 [Monilinia fructicola]|uniref:Uncharacterized protein n=1 Tax=Monilinia fructicola TaxID=38448 RepID=A0A5M9JYD2_MONFR|nr:hypothetical protein EYC84_005997 [Monilinia fructicola]